MKLGYHGHARDRMAERGVTEADVEHALLHHTERLRTPQNSMRYIGPGLDGRRQLKVWVKLPDTNPGDDKVVKSVAWKGE